MRRSNPLTIIRHYHTDERRLLKALMLVLAKCPPGEREAKSPAPPGSETGEAQTQHARRLLAPLQPPAAAPAPGCRDQEGRPVEERSARHEAFE